MDADPSFEPTGGRITVECRLEMGWGWVVMLRLPSTGQTDKAVRERTAAASRHPGNWPVCVLVWPSPSHRCP